MVELIFVVVKNIYFEFEFSTKAVVTGLLFLSQMSLMKNSIHSSNCQCDLDKVVDQPNSKLNLKLLNHKFL